MRALQFLQTAAALALLVPALPFRAQTPAYRYIRTGSPTDTAATSRPGFALMGGGEDLDEAFRFLCDRSGGGDLVVLRSHGGDDYNPYIQKLCKLNSVATLIIPSRAAAEAPFVADKLRHASALFIAGGDQGEYTTFWKNTPVQSELNRSIARGVPIGGTSAGLAVLGQFIYTSLGDKPDDPNLDAKTALADPFGPRITLDQDFLDIPLLKDVITDTHFARRNRMGRLLVFLARLREEQSPNIRAIAVDERSAVLVEPSGEARVVGPGRGAWFIGTSAAHGNLARSRPGEASEPLTFGPYNVQHVAPSRTFNLKTWSGNAIPYTLNIQSGQITANPPHSSIY